MSVLDIKTAFKCLGLETQEQRNSILSQGQLSIYDPQNDNNIQVWNSHDTKSEKDEV